jgi:hypothetical protein
MYWTAENLQDICVNMTSATLHEDGVMAPKLPIEHQVDGNRTFLTTLNIYIYIYFNHNTNCCLVHWTIENKEGVIYEEDSEDDEDYVCVDHIEHAEDGSYGETKEKVVGDKELPIFDEPDPYDYVYSDLPDDVHLLKPVDDCKKYGAKRFQYETEGFYCRDGQVKLAEQETPLELIRLWTNFDDNARHFRDHIRWFNSQFLFTSHYCSLDQDTTNLSKHLIYTFRAHGWMYHNICGFGKQDGIDSSHLELYFYDDDLALEHHFRKCRMDQQ